ncbi:MAG: F0F1 ATP synthase subunit A [Balneolaceae bacterium]
MLKASEQEAQESGGAPIDVVGTVSNHNELEYPGGHLELPRIFLVDGEWYFYGSTESALESAKFVEKGHQLVPADGKEITLDLSITSHLVYVWLAVLISMAITFAMVVRYKRGEGRKTEPRGWFQNVFESVFVFIRDDIAKNNISEDKYRKFVPYLFSVFVVITFMNLFSLVPWGATATADITVTATLAAITFFVTQWNGSKDHWEHVFWFPGVPGWMHIILTPIEIIGLFTKPFALAIRLFANMLSGKIMIICILGLIFIFAEIFGHAAGWVSTILAVPLTVALFVLKAFVSVLQAYIFTLLSAVFIGMAVEEHGHHEESLEAHA